MSVPGDTRVGQRHSMPSALMRTERNKMPASSFVSISNPTPPPDASRPMSIDSSSPVFSRSRRYSQAGDEGRYLDVDDDRRNDDNSRLVLRDDPSRGGRRHEDVEMTDVTRVASTPSPRPILPPTPPRRGGRHSSWPAPSFYRTRPNASGRPSSNDPLAAMYPRTPSPTPLSHQGGISPPEPRRILCGTSLFGGNINDDERRGDETFPVQTRYNLGQVRRMSLETPFPFVNHQIVGHPSLKIHRLKLPSHLLPLLDTVVRGCEMHASTLPTGWQTDLYSLTKQDIALREIPHNYNAAKPVISYIKKAAMMVYGVTSGIKMDRNQPHILKYNWKKNGAGHTGVELHHDKCDFTVNLMLSHSNEYSGGGTYFPSAESVVRLEFGEFLLHPGGLVHGGVNITQGNRMLLVMFVDKA